MNKLNVIFKIVIKIDPWYIGGFTFHKTTTKKHERIYRLPKLKYI